MSAKRQCAGTCGGTVTRHSASGMCIHCFNRASVGRKRSEEFRDGQRQRAIAQYNDPRQRAIRSDRMRMSWRDGSIVPGSRTHPPRSKAEQKFFEAVKALSPYEPVQGHCLRLKNGRWLLPDIFFPDINLVVEFYGDYWHANPIKYGPEDDIRGIAAKDKWALDAGRESSIIESHGLKIVWQSDSTQELRSLMLELNWECDPCC